MVWHKNLLVVLVILVLAALPSGCIRPTVEQVETQISIEFAPYIIEYRNDGWIEGAIFIQEYEEEGSYLKVTNYYDRKGFHEGVKYIPLDWVDAIIARR